MCRAEAHQLYAKKPIVDAPGIQMFAVLHEHIESEIKDFWPRYWEGLRYWIVQWNSSKLLEVGNYLSFYLDFLLNPRALANYKRVKALGIHQNFKGEGEIKGGLSIVGKGGTGIAYQFIERNFDDWAPVAETIEICARLQVIVMNSWNC